MHSSQSKLLTDIIHHLGTVYIVFPRSWCWAYYYYVNDIPEVLNSSIQMFVVDIRTYSSIRNVDDASNTLQNVMNFWLYGHKMVTTF